MHTSQHPDVRNVLWSTNHPICHGIILQLNNMRWCCSISFELWRGGGHSAYIASPSLIKVINVRPSQSSLSLLPTPSIALFPPKWIPISHSSLQNSFHVLFNRYPVLGESGWASFVSEWLIREGVFVPEDLFCYAYCSKPSNIINWHSHFRRSSF